MTRDENVLREIEATFDDIPGIRPGSGSAFETPDGLVAMCEFAADRVRDVGEIRSSAASAIEARCGIPSASFVVEVVRPGWIPLAAGRPDRDGSRRKYAAMQTARKKDRIVLPSWTDEFPEEEKDCFAYFGHSSKIRGPGEIYLPGRIHVGNWVSLGRYGSISLYSGLGMIREHVAQHYPEATHDIIDERYGIRDPRLVIGDGTYIGDQFEISCSRSITIGRHVGIATRVFISDARHHYDRPGIPPILQGMTCGTPIVIEDHAWIGINCCVLEGVRIGRHAVIGANSVVTRDIPPFTVAVGAPARPVKTIPQHST